MAVIIDEVTADVQPEANNQPRQPAPPEPKPMTRYEFQGHLRRAQRRQMRLKAD